MQYFGDAPERGYVFEKNMVPFTGEAQYQDLCRCKKKPASRSVRKKVPPLPPPAGVEPGPGLSLSLREVQMPR